MVYRTLKGKINPVMQVLMFYRKRLTTKNKY